MNLNQTWRNCLRMWKWIAKVWKKDGPNVDDLKETWLDRHGFEMENIEDDCFFCNYAREKDSGNALVDCIFCPGRLVSKRFRCDAKMYHFFEKPVEFYEKLLSLDAKRKAGRK